MTCQTATRMCLSTDVTEMQRRAATSFTFNPSTRLSKKIALVSSGRSSSMTDVRSRCSRFIRTCRSEEHTSELQTLMRTSYDDLCLKKKKDTMSTQYNTTNVTHTARRKAN